MRDISLATLLFTVAVLGVPVTAQAMQQAPPGQVAPATQVYSDAQLQSYIASRDEIRGLTRATTQEGMRQNQIHISQILRSHSLDPSGYNTIDTAARSNPALRNRVAALSVGTTFSDAELLAFAAAGREIDPISRALATATPEQRTQAGAQIRTILARYNLSSETYNGIATRAQGDTALASRIAALQTAEAQNAQPDAPQPQ